MVKELVHDPMFLAQVSTPATKDDSAIAIDLLDTLRAHSDSCVGMAANMIGVKKRIIVVSTGFMPFVMYNPTIVRKSGPYQTEESCLSLLGGPRPVTRFKEIEVEYLDASFVKHKDKYSGWIAQIIQHETDHCNGILI